MFLINFFIYGIISSFLYIIFLNIYIYKIIYFYLLRYV